MFSLLADAFFPKTSLTGTPGEWVTLKEKQAIEQTLTPLFLHEKLLRKQRIMSIDAIVAATTYGTSPLLRSVIHRYKYNRVSELHTILSSWMQKTMPGHIIPPRRDICPVLCPVPLHWTRLFSRGFNQSKLLADDLATALTWQSSELVLRTRRTGRQVERTREERLQAVIDAFSWNPDYREIPEWVILIDDVCTTGATLNECAKVLKSGGVKYVSGLVIAYG